MLVVQRNQNEPYFSKAVQFQQQKDPEGSCGGEEEAPWRSASPAESKVPPLQPAGRDAPLKGDATAQHTRTQLALHL